MKVSVKQVKKFRLIGSSNSRYTVVMDAKKTSCNSESAPTPRELLLISLGGCTLMDVISILDKKKIPYKDLKIEVDAKDKEDYPKYFTEIYLNYIVRMASKYEEDMKRAVILSLEKYCSVSNNLKGKSKIHWRVTVKEDGL